MPGSDQNSTGLSSDMRLQNAEERLARAVDRLESALASAKQATPEKTLDPALADELSRLQTENGELRTLVGRATTTLDGTIAKLKTQLQG